MRYFLCALTLFYFINAQAEEFFPSACKPLSIHNNAPQLTTQKHKLLMLHNLSNTELWITVTLSETEPNSDSELLKLNESSFSSRLEKNQWSALLFQKNTVTISCIESKPGHEQQISCQQALAMCEFLPPSKPKKTSDVFFAGENMPLHTLTAYLGRLGFELPQKPE